MFPEGAHPRTTSQWSLSTPYIPSSLAKGADTPNNNSHLTPIGPSMLPMMMSMMILLYRSILQQQQYHRQFENLGCLLFTPLRISCSGNYFPLLKILAVEDLNMRTNFQVVSSYHGHIRSHVICTTGTSQSDKKNQDFRSLTIVVKSLPQKHVHVRKTSKSKTLTFENLAVTLCLFPK